MTKDEIEKLAIEAGWPLFAIQMLAGTEDEKRLQRFAELVASSEREACARVCDEVGMFHEVKEGADLAWELAAAIRARGNA